MQTIRSNAFRGYSYRNICFSKILISVRGNCFTGDSMENKGRYFFTSESVAEGHPDKNGV
jgi:hypothetical protein